MTYALYRLYDAEGRLLYVGQSSNLLRRLSFHLTAGYARSIARIEVEHLPETATRGEALKAERVAIVVERPAWNTMHAGTVFGPPDPHETVPAGIDTVALTAAASMTGRPYSSLMTLVCVWDRARHWRTADGVRVAVDDLAALVPVND